MGATKRFLSWLFKGRKRDEGEAGEGAVVEGKTKEERIAEAAFPKIQSDLLTMDKNLHSLEASVGRQDSENLRSQLEDLGNELERIRGELLHLDNEQRVQLSGLFNTIEGRIRVLDRKNKRTGRREEMREAREEERKARLRPAA